jgi:hypothetical protein
MVIDGNVGCTARCRSGASLGAVYFCALLGQRTEYTYQQDNRFRQQEKVKPDHHEMPPTAEAEQQTEQRRESAESDERRRA